jgi:hypothetical protein
MTEPDEIRKQQLKKRIREVLGLIAEYEQKRDLASDSQEKTHYEEELVDLKGRLADYQAELKRILPNGERGMSTRVSYAIIGLFVFAAVDLLINLLAAAVQQKAFDNQFSGLAIWWLVGLVVAGLLVGHWLGEKLRLPAATADRPATTGSPQTVTITRLRALLSYAQLRGRGINLEDILLIGSRIDINTQDSPPSSARHSGGDDGTST